MKVRLHRTRSGRDQRLDSGLDRFRKLWPRRDDVGEGRIAGGASGSRYAGGGNPVSLGFVGVRVNGLSALLSAYDSPPQNWQDSMGKESTAATPPPPAKLARRVHGAAFTIARIPARSASGRWFHRSTTSAKSGDIRDKNAKQNAKRSVSVAEVLAVTGDVASGFRSSKPVGGVNNAPSGFDFHTLPLTARRTAGRVSSGRRATPGSNTPPAQRHRSGRPPPPRGIVSTPPATLIRRVVVPSFALAPPYSQCACPKAALPWWWVSMNRQSVPVRAAPRRHWRGTRPLPRIVACTAIMLPRTVPHVTFGRVGRSDRGGSGHTR